MQKQIRELLKSNGFDFMDSWQDETEGTINDNYRKGDEDITISYIINKDK